MNKTQKEARDIFTGTFMQRIIDQQESLSLIWNDAMASSPKREKMIVKKRNEATDIIEVIEEACFRRGYKIVRTAKTGLYELLRTNTSDYYKHATDKEIKQFVKDGWIRACDENQIKRDKTRLAKYNRKIDAANKERNDSLITHWRRRRMELIDNISSIEEKLNSL